MSGVSEIKCPHCGEWTTGHGRHDDKCGACGGYLEPHRFSHEAEVKVKRENPRKADYFAIKPTDGPLSREVKGFLNAFGWIVFYSEIAFYACVTGVILILGVIAG
ncbi:hypothetical protein [Mucilaginibacter sp.]|jgi:hypothetical protein|uniref:hypothetical protein n=1 Tax=Mucilaginibacter sp. TaxID=1882438 RepID=UPI002C3F1699|nr:hypothetical protein [Mucilaginibacter sp.]HTI60478.1 hypothetical protein [Mucilaginibacter sp.]